jgi:hypothetical protein
MASSGSGSSSGGSSSGTSSGSPVPTADADESEDGTRLHALYLVGSDGSKQFTDTWQDTGRNNETCSFITAADGTTRCLPAGAGNASAPYSAIYFADASCSTTPLASSSCGSPPYVVEYQGLTGSAACSTSGSYHLFSIGAAFTGSSFYIKEGTSCAATPVTASYSWFTIGAEIPASSFVQATLQAQ